MSEVKKFQEEDLEEEYEEDQDEYQGFVVDDDGKAEWCLTKIREAKADLKKWEAHYKAQADAIKKEYARRTASLERKLAEYFQKVDHHKTKTQESYKLPSGKLVLKQQEPEYDIDKEKTIPWLKENMPEFVKVVEDVDWMNLKKKVAAFNGGVVDENGEMIPGITATPRDDIFKVEVK